MPYSKHNFKEGDVLTAQALNEMEDGIKAVEGEIPAPYDDGDIKSQISKLDGKVADTENDIGELKNDYAQLDRDSVKYSDVLTGKNLCPNTGYEYGQYSSSGVYSTDKGRLITNYVKINPGVTYTISVDRDNSANIALINYNYFSADKVWLGDRVANGDTSFNGQKIKTFTIGNEKAEYVRIVLRDYTSGTNYINTVTLKECKLQMETGTTATEYEEYHGEYSAYAVTANGLVASVTKGEFDDYVRHITSGMYMLDVNMLKHKVDVTKIGMLYGKQSFCIYNGFVYSTGPDPYIYKQNMKTMQLVDKKAMVVGHGNAFQLGSGNLAYISGWDDDKVYVINLDSIALVNTITLPYSGYTNVLVDDTNEVMYIFYRSTYPSTQENYTLIKYDYVNNQEISRSKTSVRMAAMQDCDLYADRFICLNGNGTAEKPNGFRVFGKDANVLCEYHLADFAGVELEGVSIDRNTGDLYFSTYDYQFFRIN